RPEGLRYERPPDAGDRALVAQPFRAASVAEGGGGGLGPERPPLGFGRCGLTGTLFVQLASMVGAPVGGWLADLWRRRSARGRMAVQTVGVLGGAPVGVLWGMTARR